MPRNVGPWHACSLRPRSERLCSIDQGILHMPKKKTEIQKAAGRLISAIQKEWGDDLGESNADFSEDVMDRAHDILQAGTADRVRELLGPLTVRKFLGEVWVQGHPRVKPAISMIEDLLASR